MKTQVILNLAVGIFITFLFFGFLEIAAALANKTILKKMFEGLDLRTKFEQSYIPPFASKDPDKLRVFFFGGSSVQGLPLEKVGMSNQFDYQLHQVLWNKNLEIYNFGWSGNNSSVVRYLVNQTIKEKPDLLIVYTGGNEFIYPQLDSYLMINLLTKLRNRSEFIKLLLGLKEISKKSTPSFDEKIDKKRPAFRKQLIFYPLKMFLFRQNLRAIVKLAKENNIHVIFCTIVSNIREWPPVSADVTTYRQTEEYHLSISEVNDLIANKKWLEADRLLDVANSRFPNFAPLLYLKAEVTSQSGQPQANSWFIKAKDFDLIPWRASTGQNNFIRTLADENLIWVADLEKEFFANSPANLTGFQLVVDNVHPTKEGAFLIAKTIIDLLKDKKFVKSSWWQTTQPYLTLEEFLKRVGYSAADDFGIYFSSAKYCLKNPFFNVDCAQNYVEKAQMSSGPVWQTEALKASIAFVKGQSATASAYLQKAEVLKGGQLTAEEISQIPYLNQVMK